MADISRRVPGDDCEGAGERGERGKRGHRGHDGHDGATGPTGPTGPAGFTTEVVFRPDDPAGSRDNIFVTWAEAYAATQAVPGHGPLDLILDDTYTPNALVVPAGQWVMDNIRLTSVEHAHEATYELADGCQFVMANPDLGFRIKGFGLNLLCNRKGPVAPFSGIRVICEGMLLRFFNTDPLALPMFEAGPGGFALVLFSGQNMLSGFGNPDVQSVCPAPLIDAQGGTFVIEGGTGRILNNALTDTVGGGFVFFSVISDSFIGDSMNEFSFPALVTGGGVLHVDISTNHVRHLVDPQSTGTPVTAAMSPYSASYNELVLVDASTGSVQVVLPTAQPSKGERVTVKEISGSVLISPIQVVPQGTDTVDGGSAYNITTPLASVTFSNDGVQPPGVGGWWVTAKV